MKKCELCGCGVEAVGNVTKHYEPIELHKLRTENAELRAQIQNLGTEYAIVCQARREALWEVFRVMQGNSHLEASKLVRALIEKERERELELKLEQEQLNKSKR